MIIYLVDAFTTQRYAGNPAGVVILTNQTAFPENETMRLLAAELKHSEAAFVMQQSPTTFQVRYFTPVEEVDLCGHATIAAFSVLREEGFVKPGHCRAVTQAGELNISIEQDRIWMDMATPHTLQVLSLEESSTFYQAFGLDLSHQPANLVPKIVSTGLADILLPVNSRESLDEALQRIPAVIQLCENYDTVGIHLFYVTEDETDSITAHCRNFAPRFGIDEESATGTANGALTYYLYQYGLIQPERENLFLQGAAMGKPSMITSQLFLVNHQILIRIGGQAVIVMKGQLWS